MILRLEHVEHLRPECLRSLDDIRAARISFAASRELCCRPKHCHPIPDESICKLCCRQKIDLVRRHDVPARIAKRGITKILETFCALDAAWCRCPCISAAAFDVLKAHLVDVER